VDEAGRLAGQVDHPVEGGVASAEDHQSLAVELGGVAHPVVHLPVLERFGAFDAERRGWNEPSPRDHHGAGDEA